MRNHRKNSLERRIRKLRAELRDIELRALEGAVTEEPVEDMQRSDAEIRAVVRSFLTAGTGIDLTLSRDGSTLSIAAQQQDSGGITLIGTADFTGSSFSFNHGSAAITLPARPAAGELWMILANITSGNESDQQLPPFIFLAADLLAVAVSQNNGVSTRGNRIAPGALLNEPTVGRTAANRLLYNYRNNTTVRLYKLPT